MLARALLLLAFLPALAAAEGVVTMSDPAHDHTVGWTRSSPMLLGTPCGRTDIVAATLAPEGDRTRVDVQFRDLSEVCDDDNAPHQGYAVALNWQLADGGEGWTIASYSSRFGVFRGSSSWSAQCSTLAPLSLVDRCDFESSSGTPSVDAAASRVSFLARGELAALHNVYVDSVMFDCSSGDFGTVCFTGREVGAGDRMPDLPPAPLVLAES